MRCDAVEHLLPSYAEGELSTGDRADVESHLQQCPACSSLLAFLKSTADALAGFPEIEPSAELRRKLRSVPMRKKRWLGLPAFLLKPSLQPVFAAASAVLVLVSLYTFNPHKKSFDRAVARTFHRGYSQFEKLSAKAGSITDTLSAYADNVVDSLKTINPLKRSDE